MTEEFNDRMRWVMKSYHWGNRGRNDFGERNQKVVQPRPEMFVGDPMMGRRLRNLPDQHDVLGEDMPRPDIQRVQTRAGNGVLVGSAERGAGARFAKSQIPKLANAFTNEEQNRLEVYYEYPDRSLAQNELGMCYYLQSPADRKRYSVITIQKKQVDDEATVVHETLHSLREQKGQRVADTDADEAEVELETLARVSYAGLMDMKSNLGYYAYLPNGWQALQQDRVLLTGSLKRSLQGDAARAAVRAKFKQTNMSKLKIAGSPRRVPQTKRAAVAKSGRTTAAPSKRAAKSKQYYAPEWLDRFFDIDLPGKARVQVHLNQSENQSDREIVRDLEKRFGKSARIYEYVDGKRRRVA